MGRQKNQGQGFTLLEMLAALGIVVVLVLVVRGL